MKENEKNDMDTIEKVVMTNKTEFPDFLEKYTKKFFAQIKRGQYLKKNGLNCQVDTINKEVHTLPS